jgi:hypothetical protein
MITQDCETELRSVFARAGAGIEVPALARERLRQHDYCPGQFRRRMTVRWSAAVAAAGLAVCAAVVANAPTAAAGPAITFDSYTFRMPAAYHVAGKGSACRPAVEIYGHAARARGGGEEIRVVRPGYGAGMMTAASAAGGCLLVYLESVYPRTATDPDAPANARPIRVGPYRGLLSEIPMPATGSPVGPAGVDRELYVELPVRGGRMRDLAIAAAGLSTAELVTIAVNGLSS